MRARGPSRICENNFDKLDRENYQKSQWYEIYNRTRTVKDFTTQIHSENCHFTQRNHCQSCIESIEDTISLLIDKEIIDENELKALTGKQLIELQMQYDEIVKSESLIKTIQKEIRVQQKNERTRIQSGQKANENDTAATGDPSGNN